MDHATQAYIMDISSEADSSVIHTPATPPESIAASSKDDYDDVESAEPSPGSIFIIRSLSSGDVITLSEGQITLSPRADHGSNEWECVVDHNGWLAFRNPIAGRFLGRDIYWGLCCSATWFREWEKFRARRRPEGGYVLLMTHWGILRPLGIREDGRVKRLAMIESWESDELVWEFIKKPKPGDAKGTK